MARFKIQHTTKYTYEVPVRDSANQIMLYPIADDHQEIISHSIAVTGNPAIDIHRDIFDNKIGTFTHAHPHQELVINSRLEVVTSGRPAPEDNLPAVEQWKEIETVKFQIPYIDFLRLETFSSLPEALKIIAEVQRPSDTPLQAAKNICTYIYKNFTYKKGITTIETTLDEILKLKSGVCQDFAHIVLALLRLVHIPARYVSGYICPNKNGMRGEGATHAWVEAYIPSYGWLGLDPTNNCVVNENHVRLAVGKNFYDCSPVRGTYRGTSDHTMEVVVTVSYADGQTASESQENATTTVTPATSLSKNSYRRYQEMQMQQ
jgi:transglutaminase-like putative cysteine protease